jgi:hypothetical protein
VKSFCPTLAALIAGLGASTAAAVDISDNDIKLTPVLYLQSRVEIANAKDATGEDYSIEANDLGKSDTADFYIRRFRPGFKGTYQGVWKFALIWRMDDTLRAGSTATSATIHQGYVAREIKNDAITHTIKSGLDYAFFNHAEASNSTSMFPIQRAAHNLYAVRGAGLSYMLNAPMVRWGVDIMNNVADDAVTQPELANLDPDGEGLSFTTRVEVTGAGEMAIPKYQESWFGKEGTSWMVGAEIGRNQDDRFVTGAGAGRVGHTADTTCFGLDALFHWNALSALIEGRWLTRSFENDDASDTDDVKQRTYAVQVGYAFPLTSVVVEPCIRYQLIDFNSEEDNEAVNYAVAADASTATSAQSNRDYGNSGDQVDVGVNCYLNGHANKISLVYTTWKAEDGDAKANIVRIQHQINF